MSCYKKSKPHLEPDLKVSRLDRTEPFYEDLELSFVKIYSYPTVIVSVPSNCIMAKWYLEVYDSYTKEHFNKSLWITVSVYIVTYVMDC